jgi:hypothetical protein
VISVTYDRHSSESAGDWVTPNPDQPKSTAALQAEIVATRTASASGDGSDDEPVRHSRRHD